MNLPKPYRDCGCHDPVTRRRLHGACPKLGTVKGHGSWYFRYEAPRVNGRRRQPIVGPFRTEREAKAKIAETLARIGQGVNLDDARMLFGAYLDRRLRWWESERELKPKTLESYREAIELYFRPALGHVKLAELRETHFRDLYAAARLINQPAEDGTDPEVLELLRRLLEARAKVPHLPGRLASTRPLSEARIKRIHAVAQSALKDVVPNTIPFNPASGVKIGGKRGARKVKPLLWTAPRVQRWRETGQVPAPVMVWTREHCGTFLDHLEATGERLYALFHVAAYCGLRRSELAGLAWADVDLERRRLHIRQAQVDDELDSTKSEDSDRQVPIDEATRDVLAAWRKEQLEERLAWGPAWTDTGRVFTKEDGTPVRPGWISQRFGDLAERAGAPPRPRRRPGDPEHPQRDGLPPIRFHDLRHGCATLLLAAGQPAKVISEVLGHSTVSFTLDVYTEVAEELADAAMEALAAYIPRASRPTRMTWTEVLQESGRLSPGES